MANGTAAPRCAALIGPYLSGKTTLLEALLHAAGSTSRRGSVRDGNSVGDHTPEARARQMSTEINVANATFLGDPWSILNRPGSVELLYEAQGALLVSDVAVVVVEPEAERALTTSSLLRFLDRHKIPHMIFINKMDTANARVRDVLAALQSVSGRPLVLRQVPLRGPDSEITGYVDLVSERAYRYRPGQPSDLIPLPDDFWDQERDTRTGLIEKLADFDDELLEKLLEDVEPQKEEIYRHLTRTLSEVQVVPVFVGSGLADWGVRRLWKALRHETPSPQATAERLGIAAEGEPLAQVMKTYHLPHTGKLSLVRVWRGTISEGMVLNGTRVAVVLRLVGAQQEKVPSAQVGEVVGLTRMEDVQTGAVLTPSGKADPLARPERPQPVFGLAIHSERRQDDVKLTGAIGKLIEEDPTLGLEQNADTQEMVLWGQGDIHLQIALDRLRNRHNLEVKALPRGSGFTFTDSVVGGAIPRNYIPAVEEGVVEALRRGPLGFPVVDVAVTLITGQFHSVDSSDQAFHTAGRQAIQEALPKCEPILLEPIDLVEISVPNAFTARVQRLVSGRRGQILGYDAKPDWPGWDVGSFAHHFDHMQEMTGRPMEKVLAMRTADAAQ